MIIGYFVFRKFRFGRRKIRINAQIDRIHLCTFDPDMIVPEVEIKYKYYYEKGVYYGEGFVGLADLLGTADYKIYMNHNLIPVFCMEDKVFVSEEQIETYLLSIRDSLYVYIDPVEPFHSEIDSFSSESIEVTSPDA